MKPVSFPRAAFALIVFASGATGLHGQAGHPDPTFRSTNLNGFVYSIALQGDGKIVIGGSFTEVNGLPASRIARLQLDGSLDPTFNPGLGADDAVFDIAIQTDGKIVAGGIFDTLNGSGAGVARLNPDGSRDTSFSAPLRYVSTLAFHPSGHIYTARGREVRRLNPDGTPDAGFSLTMPEEGFGAFPSAVNDFLVLPNGRVLVGGNFYEVNGETHYNLARLNVDGSLDSAFFADPAISSTEILALARRNDGKIYAGSWTLQRAEADGAWDSSFAFFQFGPLFNSVAVQQDGKPLVAWRFSDVQGRMLFGRFNNDGSIDETFSGFVDGQVEVIAVQPDGRIVIGGSFGHVNGSPHAGIARLLGDAPVIGMQIGSHNDATLSWPAAYTNWVLQEAKEFKPDKWKTVHKPPILSNGLSSVNQPIGGRQRRFYRLVQE